MKMKSREMYAFIRRLDCAELREEITTCDIYPPYFQAVRKTLIALGYDPEWVTTTFREALEEMYL